MTEQQGDEPRPRPSASAKRPKPLRAAARPLANAPKASSQDDDSVLRRQILGDLARRGLNASKNLRIDVDCRFITISGEVSSADQKASVLRTVRQCPGVLDVHDALTINATLKQKTVSPKTTRSFPIWLPVVAGSGVVAVSASLFAYFRDPAQSSARGSDRARLAQAPDAAIAQVVEAVPQPVGQRPGGAKVVNRSSIELYPARGRVTFKGQAAVGAYVVFHPLQGPLPKESKPSGHVEENGWYQLATYDFKDGAPAGEYLVTVTWRSLSGGDEFSTGKSLLSARYGAPETSGLRATLAPQRNEIPEIKLTD